MIKLEREEGPSLHPWEMKNGQTILNLYLEVESLKLRLVRGMVVNRKRLLKFRVKT